MKNLSTVFLVAAVSAILSFVDAVELTFELPDNAKECFYEVIEQGTESTLEFQVDSHKQIFCKHMVTVFH